MKILGLDLGTNSLGWAVVETENKEQFELLEKGVRIFTEGVKIEKGVEKSRAAERTEARGKRRLYFRRKLRKYETLKVLINNNMCPLSILELQKWRQFRNPLTGTLESFKNYPISPNFLSWLQTKDQATIKHSNPYYFRAKAVEKKISPIDLGRALYHIAQRRGFLSNRLEGTKENDGVVKAGISELSKEIDDSGCKTLGQYFYKNYIKSEKVRTRYTHREEHYLAEFKEICKIQEISKELENELERAIFYQRPLKSQKGLIGKCSFEKSKARCPISHPLFEEYRMWSFINNIKMKSPDDEHLRSLTDEEKESLLDVFYRKSSLQFTFDDIAKRLTPRKCKYEYFKSKKATDSYYLYNYDLKTSISGCSTESSLKSIFGKDWKDTIVDKYVLKNKGDASLKSQEEIVNDIWHVLFTFDSEKCLKKYGIDKLQLSEEDAIKFSKITLKQGYAQLSIKAIKQILPYLKEGLLYSHAVFMANMPRVVGESLWNKQNNKVLINNAVKEIIKNHKVESLKLNAINALLHDCIKNKESYSEEAIHLYEKDIRNKLENEFGKRRFDALENKDEILEQTYISFQNQYSKNRGQGEFLKNKRIDDRVIEFLDDNGLLNNVDSLYHPSDIDIFKKATIGKDGIQTLGSPMVPSIKNPMAMRAMFQLRLVVNTLLERNIIDSRTQIHIELARGLNNANKRKAISRWQKSLKDKKDGYVSKIKEHKGELYEPSVIDILKYQLWEEQNGICIYTGKTINIENLIGANPSFDIEHTIPRSLSYDDSQVNKTLCDSKYNRDVKRNQIPYELNNHKDILLRLSGWKDKYIELESQINKVNTSYASDKEIKDAMIQKRHRLILEKDYWKNKYSRFIIKDVPSGFKNSQLVDTGIITKYARAYMNTVFPKVFLVKGDTVAQFRKYWGIQDEYEKKERINHVHHCIDAVTIACMTKKKYDSLAYAWKSGEDGKIKEAKKIHSNSKPWKSFTEDVKDIEKEILISHYTPDVLPKNSKRILRSRGKKCKNSNGEFIYMQGDSARASLHLESFYGAIANNKDGQENLDKKGNFAPKYVIRKFVDTLKATDIENIVDPVVRDIIKKGKANKEIEFFMPNKNGTPIPIKKVRCYTALSNPIHLKRHRDESKHDYKRHLNVDNDENYLTAIYEGEGKNGKVKRAAEVINNLSAATYYKVSNKDENDIIPNILSKKNLDLKLRVLMKKGTMVLFYTESPEELFELSKIELSKRLYETVGLNGDSRLKFRFHKVARPDKELKEVSKVDFNIPEDKLIMSISNLNILIDGIDFKLSPIGEITKI